MKNKQFEEQFLRALTEKVLKDEALETVQPEELSAGVFSDTAERKEETAMSVLDRRMQRHFRRSRLRAAVGKVGKAAAMFAAVLLIGGVLLLCFSTTARAAFERWTHDIYENRIRYIFHGKPEEEYKLPLYEAGWLPEGVKLVEVQGDPWGFGYTSLYQNDDESVIIILGVDLIQEGSHTELTQMEGYEHETLQFEGIIIEDYYRGEDDRTAYWFVDDDQAFVIADCSLTREELLKFIKNLKRIN